MTRPSPCHWTARRRSCAALLLVVIGFLFGCGTAPTRPSVDTRALQSQAAAAVESGDLRSAQSIYGRLAEATSGPERSQYLIEGAKLGIELGALASAAEQLTLAESGASRDQRQAIEVYRARIELERGNAGGALAAIESLGGIPAEDIDAEASGIRGEALFALERPVDAIRVLVEREIWLNDRESILANQTLIWEGIGRSGPLPATAGGDDPLITGWLELAPAAGIDDDAEQRRALIEWRLAHTDHPAARGLLAELLSVGGEFVTFPSRIALLLPLGTAATREQAVAIRDGFMAAHFQYANNGQVQIRVYDTSEEGGAAAYLRAQVDGADFIVGPLRRDEVDDVVTQAGFVPTLALNFSQLPPPALTRFYQFALSPEDEARGIARRGRATGARTAIAITQGNARGYRILSSFVEEFEAMGGRMLGTGAYASQGQDLAGVVSGLLNISDSQARNRELEAALGLDLEFEPRRRQDIDMIFLSADPPEGRLLVPQLEFYYAGNVPTYATSDVYDPANSARETDLDQLIFSDIPWVVSANPPEPGLRDQLEQYWPERARFNPRFYALGFDAYSILRSLHDPLAANFEVDGLTGRLRMDQTGRIHRDLGFAQIIDGFAQPLAPASAPTQAIDARRIDARRIAFE